jgi:N-acetylglutamate synthase-like GNAT family acetyltransferase
LTARSFSAEYLPFLVENDDGIQGMALGIIVHYGSLRQAYLEDVVIDEASRGSGIGRFLIEHILQEMWNRDVEVVFVATSFDNDTDSPLPFYQALGFHKMRCPWLVMTR